MGRTVVFSYLASPSASKVGVSRFGRLLLMEHSMNNIVWLVGAVVIVLAVLGFFGLR